MRLAACMALFSFCSEALSQYPDPVRSQPGAAADATSRKLPNGKTQSDEILKADHAKSLQDLKQITELSQALALDMEHDTSHVLSLNSLKKIEEIEKLAKRVHGRMRRL